MLATLTDQSESDYPAYLRRTTYGCPSICMSGYNYDDRTGDYSYAAASFDNDHRIHALCALYSFCLFELLSQRPSLLRLVDGRQIVYKKAVR
ncbi:uncharacterized protein ASPGLDRAFT_712100 [Aspergillus glaucus CBS 516.65]|uniref:Uncharacterized protein n=1 Tax=Aspergillus glaucus CBS 516.65 TaxID=1160497 RepID=A0A1L9VX73_ASPGL|nr:hypothetical protein ASPGLDRAFT_712100 [Aspergillus glaucus CBS 516.65]OJJ88489.1 hypothetical protein ASPGLDRAFT_712100 [Aspergillus glaucus CBS 516.65]